jgi:GNAT superfamily N-acetyltransferase
VGSLLDIVARVERHEHVTADSWLQVVPSPSPGRAAVVSFPGFIVVAADVERAWVESWMGDGDFARPTGPPFLSALEELLRVEADALDAVVLADPLPGEPPLELTPLTDKTHPRVRRALRYRAEVQVWTSEQGVLVLGRGLAGRWEAAIEVTPAARNKGHGRALATAARHLAPEDRPVWAQIAPGNASSLRAFLSAGYHLIGSEVLLIPPA